MAITDRAIDTRIDRLLAERGPGKTLCPSEVARALAPEGWRALMPRIRRVAARRAGQGTLRVLQKGRPVDAATARGPWRLGAAPGRIDDDGSNED